MVRWFRRRKKSRDTGHGLQHGGADFKDLPAYLGISGTEGVPASGDADVAVKVGKAGRAARDAVGENDGDGPVAGIVNIVKGVASGLAEPIVDYFKTARELKSKERLRKEELKDAHHQRNMDLAKAGLTADMNWEMTFAQQAATSWKDEYTLIVVSIPAIMAFVKLEIGDWSFDGPAIVAQGFQSLAGTPVWYQILLGTMFGATVGVRWWRRSQYDTEDPYRNSGRFVGPVAPLQPHVLPLKTGTTGSDKDYEVG